MNGNRATSHKCRAAITHPDAIGLAVPGMPIGSPGLDSPAFAQRQEPFDVLLVAHDGSTRIFNSHFKQKERS